MLDEVALSAHVSQVCVRRERLQGGNAVVREPERIQQWALLESVRLNEPAVEDVYGG